MIQGLVAKRIKGLGDGVNFFLQSGRHADREAGHGTAFKKWIETAFRVKVNAKISAFKNAFVSDCKQFKMGF